MTRRLPIILVAMSIAVADAYAQHEGHQMAGMTASAASNPACAEAGRKALAIVEAASTRFESASRESGTAERLADLQRAVGAAQAQLFTCRAAVTRTPAAAPPADAMAGMDHSKMAMGKPAPGTKPAKPGAKSTDAMAGMDHSKMAMGKPPPGAKPAKPGAKPAEPMAGMDHSKMAMAGAPPKTSDDAAPRIADPACPDNVGQATAPKAVYERKVYYFCSTRTRDDFRKNPAAYLKKHPR